MSRNGGRKLLYSPQYIAGFASAYREARRDLDDMHAKHLREMAELRRELDETRAEFDELKAAVLARQHAEQELAGLYRARDIARAEAAERDPNAALN